MKKILVVEDNLDIVNLLKLVLSRNYEVEIALDGHEAMQCIKEKSFDLIITDYLMPRVNGLEFVSKVKNQGFQGEIIVSSSYLSDEVAQKFEELKIRRFFKKPYIISELHEYITDVFNKR